MRLGLEGCRLRGVAPCVMCTAAPLFLTFSAVSSSCLFQQRAMVRKNGAVLLLSLVLPFLLEFAAPPAPIGGSANARTPRRRPAPSAANTEKGAPLPAPSPALPHPGSGFLACAFLSMLRPKHNTARARERKKERKGKRKAFAARPLRVRRRLERRAGPIGAFGVIYSTPPGVPDHSG